MNYYEHHIGDYLKDTSRLSLQEHGAYLLLLSDYYANECPLPADATELYRITRAMSKAERAAVMKVANDYFPIVDGARHNKRADEEIARFVDKREKARDAINKRWASKHTDVHTDEYTGVHTGVHTDVHTDVHTGVSLEYIPSQSPVTKKDQKQDQKQKPPARASARVPPLACPADVQDSTWRDWLALRKAKRAPVSATVVTRARAEAGKAAMPFEEFLAEWCERGSQGLKAEWIKNSEKRDAKRNSGVVAQGASDLREWLEAKRGNAGVHLGADDGALRLAVDEAPRNLTVASR